MYAYRSNILSIPARALYEEWGVMSYGSYKLKCHIREGPSGDCLWKPQDKDLAEHCGCGGVLGSSEASAQIACERPPSEGEV